MPLALIEPNATALLLVVLASLLLASVVFTRPLNRFGIPVVLLFLVLGMFLDAIAIMVMTLPVMFPILVGVGYDPIWLGVIAIKLAEISLITPPVGLNVYVVRSASPVPITLNQAFAGVMPTL